MASILKVDTLTGVTTAGSISVTGEGNSTTTNLQQGLAKSWANFNGEGTAAILDSMNTASLTDSGTGTFSITFTNAMVTYIMFLLVWRFILVHRDLMMRCVLAETIRN